MPSSSIKHLLSGFSNFYMTSDSKIHYYLFYVNILQIMHSKITKKLIKDIRKFFLYFGWTVTKIYATTGMSIHKVHQIFLIMADI